MSTAVPDLPWYHIGPHGYYDLVRLARRERTILVRLLYMFALLTALAVVHVNTAPRHATQRDAHARVAEQFCVTVLLMQNFAVLLLTPIYLASSIQEERERGTLPLLFTTHLTARQIVLGKWLSRSGHIGGILLSGLPILAFVQLWGGIDMPMIVANFWNTGCLLLCVGALSLVLALKTSSVLGAVVKTYLFLVGAFFLGCCCGFPDVPLGLLLTPTNKGVNGYAIMTTLTGALTIVYLCLTIWLLRRASLILEAMRTDAMPPPEEMAPVGRQRFRELSPIPEEAVQWKERYLQESEIPNLMAYGGLLSLLSVMFLHFSNWIAVYYATGPGPEVLKDLTAPIVYCMLGSFYVYALLVTVRLTGCITRERQQQTLETLLTLPLSAKDLLRQKLVGNLLRYRHWLLVFGSGWLYLMLFGDGWRVHGGFVLVFVLAIHLAFFAALGLFLSVYCRTSIVAHGTLGATVFGLFIAMPMLLMFLGASDEVWDFQRGMNPLLAGATISNEWWRHGRPTALQPIFECTFLYLAAAPTLWLLACRRLARDPLGTP